VTNLYLLKIRLRVLHIKNNLINIQNIQRYRKQKKAKCIILSLKEPTFLDEKSCYISQNDVFWYYLSYETFVEKYLKKLIKKIPEEDKYNKFLICDYINFIEILNQNILGLINKAQIINIYKVGTCENDALKVLKELRMHDFFQKAIFENFKVKIEDKIDKLKIDKLNIKKLKISTFYTNQQGGIDIKYEKDGFYYGIQIEGNQYRQLMEGHDGHGGYDVLKKANSIYKNNTWFKFHKKDKETEVKAKDNRPRKQIGFDNKNNFCQYSKFTFIYKYVLLKDLECTSEDELIDIIIEDLKKINLV